MTDYLACRRLSKSYVMGPKRLEVLRDASLEVAKGEYLAIAGASGSGKLTLLHLVGLLDRPDSGEVIFEGRAISGLSGRAKDALRNRTFGFVFQFYHLLPEFDALENVAMPLMIASGVVSWMTRRSKLRARAREMLERVGLGGRLRHKPSQLSGGERQRVAIARALAADPEVILADEPTGNLDATTGAGIMELLGDLNDNEGKTLVVVTHDERLAARAQRLLKLEAGRLRKP